ncbi:MAG: glyoxalase [Acidobacteria bacterium]|nr:MAG: glyoxalase [Acidobacteriota bacterium]
MPNTSIRGHFVWHELMTSDTKSAERFYARVVGWTPEAWGQDPSYKMWMAGGRPMGGLMGIPRGEGTPPPPQWFCYIGTPDVDATVRQAVELGGKVMKPAQDLPTVGRFAFLFDPQGAAFAAFTPAPSSMPRNAGEPGLADFSWHELATTNWQAAWDFYSKLFGWQKTSAMDMGPQGTYQMFGLDGRVLGGMYSSTVLPGPPSWLPYALVPDSKRAAAVVKQVGGTIVNGPMEVPGGDWIVMGRDPQGVAFAVHSKKPAAAAAAAPKASGAARRRQTSPAPKTARKRATTKARPARKRAAAKRSGTKRKPARRSARKPRTNWRR